MKKGFFKYYAVLALLCGLLPSALWSQATVSSNETVVDIQFTGLKTIQPSQVKDFLRLRVGQPFNEEYFNDAVKTLASLEMFDENVKGYTEKVQGGISVRFELEETPFIQNIRFEGNSSVSRDDLEKELLMSRNSYYPPYKKETDLQAMKNKYMTEGFIDAEIESSLVTIDAKNNVYDLLFKIKEGNKVVVEQINIAGASQIPAGDIKFIMKTKEKVFILQSGVLVDKDFLEDQSRIIALYQQKGFLDTKINKMDWTIDTLGDDKHKAIIVNIELDEGQKYYIGNIKVQGNNLFLTNELLGLVDLKPGDVCDKIKGEMGRYNIYNQYSDRGHLYANVSLVMNQNPSNRLVDMEFVIYEGERAHIENINIKGNNKTEEYVIRRELLFNEGELYINRKVRDTYERLMQLQYFSDIQFQPSPGGEEGLINLDINVAEQRTGLITFGVGYGTESGINGSGQISERNLFGTGRIVAARLEYGQRRQLLELSFTEPWLFNSPTYAGISFSFSRQIYDNIPVDDNFDGIIDGTNFNYVANPTSTLSTFTSTNLYYKWNISAGANISRRFFLYWTTYLSYTISWYKYADANFKNPIIYTDQWDPNSTLSNAILKQGTLKHTVGWALNFNNTDNPINPLKGGTIDLGLYYNGGIFGGDISYNRARAAFNFYWNPFWKMVLALHASTEFILPQFDGTFKYDTADMTYFDGTYEMRGFNYNVQYGESKALLSTEIRFPIYGQELWGVLFFDYGNLWDKYDKGSLSPEGSIFSFGIGAKINIPMLPIRLYLARKGYYDSTQGKYMLETSQNFFENWQIVFSIQGLY